MKIIAIIPVSTETQEDTLGISALNFVFFLRCVPFHSLSDVVSSPLNVCSEGIPNVLLCSIPIDPLLLLTGSLLECHSRLTCY